MPPRSRQTNTASTLAARHTRARRSPSKATKSEKPKRPRKRPTRRRAAPDGGFGGMLRGVGKLMVAMIVISAVAIIFRSMTRSQFFAVKEIALEGNNRTSREELMELVKDKTGDSLWKLDLEEIRKTLKRNAWVRDAEVTRQLPDKLRVKINEREPYALVRRSDSTVVWIDRDGTILGDHSRFNREVIPPIISGLAEGLTPKVMEANQRHLDLYQQLLGELDSQEPHLSPQVDEVIFDGVDGLKLRVREGRVVVLVGTKDFRKRLEEALRILQAVERKDISALQLMRISDAERLLSGKPIAYINATVPGRAIVGLAE
jgi:cell division septal protein FtsQ